MPKRHRAAATIALGALLLAPLASAQSKPLWVLDLTVTAKEPLELERALRVRLYSDAPEKLASPLSGVVSVASDHLVLDLTPEQVLSRDVPAAPVPSFIIDYDTEAVAALNESLVERFGATPSNGELVSFMQELVDTRLGHPFDIASTVATQRAGDCSEHAVLLAALARSVGLPARVAIGTVIVRNGEKVGAFGHAWTEIYREGKWSLVDSTPLGDDVPVSYVPEGLLENEGPGYMLGLGSLLASGILRVEVVGNAAATGGS